MYFRETDLISEEAKLSKLFCQGKFFSLTVDPFYKVFGMQEGKSAITKIVSLIRNCGKSTK